MRWSLMVVAAWLLVGGASFGGQPQEQKPLALAWANNLLHISGENVPGEQIVILSIEAYCRPGSTYRRWEKTLIGHKSERVEHRDDGTRLVLRDRLSDGVVVTHTITAGSDEVDFRLVAHNPTEKPSEAHWAQPCLRVDRLTGTTREDA